MSEQQESYSSPTLEFYCILTFNSNMTFIRQLQMHVHPNNNTTCIMLEERGDVKEGKMFLKYSHPETQSAESQNID